MIHVRIDRPMREHDVGVFGGEESCHRVNMRVSHLGRAVDLAEEPGARTEDAAGHLTLGGADACHLVQRLPGDAALAAREVNDGYFVTQGHIPRQRAAAARFGIVWVPADTHDLQMCRVGRDRQCKRRKGARGDCGRALDETATIEVVFRHGPSLAIPLNPATSPPVGAYNLGRNKHDTQDECSHRRHCLSPLHRCRISEHAAI